MVKIDNLPLNENETLLHDRAQALARNYLLSEREVLQAIMQVNSSAILNKLNKSLYQYCTDYLNLSPAVAYNFMTVANKSKVVPLLAEAVLTGEISLSAARKVTPVITPETSEKWIAKAQALPQKSLEREVAGEKPQAGVADQAKHIGKGWMLIKANLTEESWAKVQRAKEVLGVTELNDVFGAALDALLEKRDPLKKAERAREKPVSDRSERVMCEGRAHEGRAREVRDRNGRAPIPAALEHAVNKRDQRMFAGLKADGVRCGSKYFLEFHHLVPVAHGGKNTLENLTTLCSSCHRRWHLRSTDPAGARSVLP
jgi:5-methylcytosine-specific restriction endonuclease McrA